MKKWYVALALVFVVTVGVRMIRAQTLSFSGEGVRYKAIVEKLDPALDAIVSPDAQMVAVTNGFTATEGLVWIQDPPSGHLLFCDRSVEVNVVYKMTSNGKTEVAVKQAGYRGPWDDNAKRDLGHLHTNGFDAKDPHYREWISSGCDGLGVDPQGRLLIATFGGRTIERLEKDGRRTVLADRYEGKRFNGTDDITVRRDGTIYFSDIYDFRTNAKSPLVELHQAALYMIKDGKVTQALTEQDNPGSNGVALSPDEKYLYVTTAGKKLSRYEVQPDGMLKNGKLFVELNDSRPGSPDGLRADSQGNVYCSGPGGVWIFSPSGKHLGTIKVPENFASFGFGDPDYKTLYIGGETTIYMVPMNVAGIHF
jgi:gluconolactonase